MHRSGCVMALTLATVVGFSESVPAGDWWEKIDLKGDLRYRHEMIRDADNDARHRHRIRARLGIYGEVSAYTGVGIQLATGSDDPVSTNQTLDNAFSTKQIGIDLAYIENKHEALPGWALTIGKFQNPFFKPGKSELIWDSDWNPEGGTLKFHKDGDNFDLTLIGSGLWIEERPSDPNSFILAGQLVGRFHFNQKQSSIAVGGGLFSYTNTQGYQPFHESDDSKGNSVVEGLVGDDTVSVYTADFELLEIYAEATHKFEGTPVTVLADYVSNAAADSLENGWLLGVRVGRATKSGNWAFRYSYRRVEKDAVVGAFTDSDFRGGGTDAQGHELGGSVQLARNTTFNVSYFANEVGLEDDDPSDFKRLQIDLQLKF